VFRTGWYWVSADDMTKGSRVSRCAAVLGRGLNGVVR